nr:endonuclease Q family protein [Planctomycetota bacterium]
MKQVLDLHIHSKFSRACSKNLFLEKIAISAAQKGVNIIATGDFTHPAWFKEIENKLETCLINKKETGLYKVKEDILKQELNLNNANLITNKIETKFILGTEVSLIYKDGDRARRIHLVIHAPSIEAVRELNNQLGKSYNIKSDGRPILGIKAPELIKLCLAIHPKFLIYPAHIWTPWFSVFGSKSGFNTLEECFKEQTEYIYAFETGLSSDPEMNWRLSALDKLTVLSNSDAHSLPNIGREANIMDLTDITYEEIYQVIKNKDLKKLKGTIEFYPEEGMYHFDGHRDCGFSCTPTESKKHKNICPVCKKPLIIGVMNRVEELADRLEGHIPKNATPFKKTVELDKIIAEALNIKSRSSQKVQVEYNNLLQKLGSELDILLEIDINEIKKYSSARIAEGVERVREGNLLIKP